MLIRQLACRCMERGARAVFALGVLGMLGFVASLVAFSRSALDASGFMLATTLSLVLYGVALLLGHLGDPVELERRQRLRPERALPLAAFGPRPTRG